MYTLNFFRRGLRVAQTIILARLLTPEHFGIVGIATIAMAVLDLFSNTGLKKALIQRKDPTPNILNVVWTTHFIRGVVTCVLFFVFAPVIAGFFESPRALPVIRAVAFCFLFNGLRNVGIIYFSRELEFHKRFVCEIGGVVSGFVVSVSLVFILKNEWAIVWAMLASSMVITILSYVTHSYRPGLAFDWNTFRELFRYSKWVILTGIFAFIPPEGIKVVLTKCMGVTSLGIYIIALRFANLPAMMFSDIVKRVLFPAYAKLQDEKDRLKETYLKTLDLLSFVCIPFAGALIIFARPFIVNFLGKKWIDSVLPMQILVPAFVLEIVTNSGTSLFYAYGKPQFSFYINLCRFCTLLVCIVPAIAQFGLAGAAFSYLLSSIASGIFWLYGLKRIFGVKLRDFAFVIFPLTCAISIATCIFFLRKTMPLNKTNVFLSVVVGSVLLYLVIVVLIDKFTNYKVLRPVKTLLPKKL